MTDLTWSAAVKNPAPKEFGAELVATMRRSLDLAAEQVAEWARTLATKAKMAQLARSCFSQAQRYSLSVPIAIQLKQRLRRPGQCPRSSKADLNGLAPPSLSSKSPDYERAESHASVH
jgi:hypothetical protein